MRTTILAVLSLAVLFTCSEAQHFHSRFGHHNPSFRNFVGFRRPGQTSHGFGGGRGFPSRFSRPRFPSRFGGGCGGHRQECCQTGSACGDGLHCMVLGERAWFSAKGRCVHQKRRRECGLEGMECCKFYRFRKCSRGLECVHGDMCRNHANTVNLGPGVVGQSSATFQGWLLVRVRAFGGKCYVRIFQSITATVQTFGEGTFAEVFGSLTGVAECEDGAQGKAIGYIRADAISSATLTENGCVSLAESQATSHIGIQGEGISVALGADIGAAAGCNRKML